MDGERETNATPTPFFQGISDKLESQQQQQQQQQRQPLSSSRLTVTSSNGVHVMSANHYRRGGAGGGATPPSSTTTTPTSTVMPVSTLITQVSQHVPPSSQQQRNVGHGGGYGDSSGMDGSGNAHAGPRVAGGSTSVTTGSRQRVHATELVERARYIRNQPKNTSPIDASVHPSLLPDPLPAVRNKKCLILDVDETLVHSSYQSTGRYDVHLPITLDHDTHVNVYVAFRPHLHRFLEAVAPLFEVVIFTASLSTYCDPLIDSIDKQRILGGLRLFREHCSVVGTTYVKDLSLLGRNLEQVAIIDNSPIAYLFQQRNAIPITSWFDDSHDEELLRLIPVLEALAEADTVYDVLDNYNALLQLQQHHENNREKQ
ncbi:NLI_interacting_factor-like_phosphatase (plasmid) [Leishmania braziliensis MHOM/BR/75/M2904]|uniref:NLI_interacting_factor-like_phosphatase n=1 Tax=Leishmania braziliensis MHOM/BR/75/M2904 TaxID=420245 RepID=A0A3P3Z8N6_LEIBR|nr:NLI interacting factorlike phosphatase [Leishmania braziliensis]SYZ66619.1 NLI_interacting_factor-like_phosphatase [Leishmania braziliensis MHOM/BR/75/M2904]